MKGLDKSIEDSADNLDESLEKAGLYLGLFDFTTGEFSQSEDIDPKNCNLREVCRSMLEVHMYSVELLTLTNIAINSTRDNKRRKTYQAYQQQALAFLKTSRDFLNNATSQLESTTEGFYYEKDTKDIF